MQLLATNLKRVIMLSHTESVRRPPHSVEAEQSLIGGLLLDNTRWDNISDKISAEDFYQANHKIIFAAIAELARLNQPFDVVTVAERLKTDKEFLAQGGFSYLGELANRTPGVSNIGAYAEIIREQSTLRRLLGCLSDIAEEIFNAKSESSADILDRAEQRIFRIAEGKSNDNATQHINAVLKKTIDHIDYLMDVGDAMTGLTTGFSGLDDKTSGLQKSDLIIVAARPSMGKTAFSMNLAENALIKTQKPVLVFSMEMPAEAIVMRMLSSLGRIHQSKVRTGQIGEDDWPKLTAAVSLLRDKPLYIDDTPALSPTELRSKARRVARENNGELGLILIDYLQLMQVPGNTEGRTSEISEISRSLKALAKELECPVVALSQLNRALEKRDKDSRRPINSDLRDSGAIEQDADVIMFIYRDEYYNEDSPDKGLAEIIIGKQRNGPTGTVKLAFHGAYTKFEDTDERGYESDY